MIAFFTLKVAYWVRLTSAPAVPMPSQVVLGRLGPKQSRRHLHRREGVLARADDAQDHIAATANRRVACVICRGSESVRSTSGSATPTSRDIVIGRNRRMLVLASYRRRRTPACGGGRMSGFLGEGNAYDRVSFIESGVLGALDKRTCGTDAVRDRARPPRTETVSTPL